MGDEMKLFKKKNGTGMHMTFLSEGSKINNQPVQGKQVLRPGNTVLCFEEELGVSGRKQFDLASEKHVDSCSCLFEKPFQPFCLQIVS